MDYLLGDVAGVHNVTKNVKKEKIMGLDINIVMCRNRKQVMNKDF